MVGYFWIIQVSDHSLVRVVIITIVVMTRGPFSYIIFIIIIIIVCCVDVMVVVHAGRAIVGEVGVGVVTIINIIIIFIYIIGNAIV